VPYLRAVRAPNWTGIERGEPEAIARAAADLVERGERASVFSCASLEQVELVAVRRSCAPSRDGSRSEVSSRSMRRAGCSDSRALRAGPESIQCG
jgi:hypothetical protein